MKSREVELGSHSRMNCLAAELFLNSCFSDTVFVTVETAVSEVHKLLGTGGVPIALTWLFGGGWRSLRTLRVGAQGRASHLYPTHPSPTLLSPSLISLMVSADVIHHSYLLYLHAPFPCP